MRRAPGEHLPLTPADNHVPGALPGRQDRWSSAGRDRAAPCTNAAVAVHVMTPRRAAAGLAAAQMVQLMAAGARACPAAIASAAGAQMVSRPGSAHGRRERLDGGTADAAAIGRRGS
jgi:hypothetical protein